MNKAIPQDSKEAIDVLQDVLNTLEVHNAQKEESNSTELLELLDFTDEDIANALFNKINWVEPS